MQTRYRRKGFSLFPLFLVLLGSASAEERHLPVPAHLSKAARQLVKQKMVRHSTEMTELVWAVVLLDYSQASNLAKRIAEEPRFGRSLTNDATELNSDLPERFFELQDQLKARAGRLAQSARARNTEAMGTDYGKLAETCVGCHRAYLNEAPVPPTK